MQEKIWKVTGMMSGTSLDGLDLVACEFKQVDQRWKFEILASETIEYSKTMREHLNKAIHFSSAQLLQLDAEIGSYFGNAALEFNQKNHFEAEFIASHGHTIFHQPHSGFTTQIGRGSNIAVSAGIPVVCDFRTSDVALGGQGAPLVPMGDRLLFSEYDYCLNLGGIANISFETNGERIAYDICPVNMALNYLSRKIGLEFDRDGARASTGKTIEALRIKMDELDFYRQPPPRSLGREWFDQSFLPLISGNEYSTEDLLLTCCEHISGKIAGSIKGSGSRLLITGGGAWNSFLIDKLRSRTKASLIIPDPEIVNFKEALIFAFLGLLRWNGVPNCLGSVTGAIRNVSGGCIYLP